MLVLIVSVVKPTVLQSTWLSGVGQIWPNPGKAEESVITYFVMVHDGLVRIKSFEYKWTELVPPPPVIDLGKIIFVCRVDK